MLRSEEGFSSFHASATHHASTYPSLRPLTRHGEPCMDVGAGACVSVSVFFSVQVLEACVNRARVACGCLFKLNEYQFRSMAAQPRDRQLSGRREKLARPTAIIIAVRRAICCRKFVYRGYTADYTTKTRCIRLYNVHASPRAPCVAIQLYSAIHYTAIHRYTLYMLYNTPRHTHTRLSARSCSSAYGKSTAASTLAAVL